MAEDMPATAAAVVVDDCWNRTGTFGDRTCAQLAAVETCGRCPVRADAAERLFARPPAPGWLAENTAIVAAPLAAAAGALRSAMVFRCGGEWFALETRLFDEIAPAGPVHTLPHRRGGALSGLTVVRGQLLLCLSLARLLGLAAAPAATGERHGVVQLGGGPVALVLEEVAGTLRYDPARLTARPATLPQAAAALTAGLLPWRDRMAALIDPPLLRAAVERML